MAKRAENPMNLIMIIAVGILTLVAIITVGPVVGGSIELAMPEVAADSPWNVTTNDDLPEGAATWTQLIPLVVLAVLALIIGLVIMYFRNAAR